MAFGNGSAGGGNSRDFGSTSGISKSTVGSKSYGGSAGTGSRASAGANRGGSGGLGITTGKTMYGNTAYGPAGGKATGYATATTKGGKTTYSNYRNLDGSKANVQYAGSGGAGNTRPIAQKTSKPYVAPAAATYKKPPATAKMKLGQIAPKVAAAAKKFGKNYAGKAVPKRIYGVVGGSGVQAWANTRPPKQITDRVPPATKQIYDRVPVNQGELRWRSPGITGKPGK